MASVNIQDAELLRRLGGQVQAESAEPGSLRKLQDSIQARTGLRVVARVNESTGAVDVKRVLIEGEDDGAAA
jgi:hypothetical protein